MARKAKKIIFISLALLFIMAFSVAFYLFNKRPVDVKSSSGIRVEAIELYRSFTADSLAARKKFGDEVLEVTGEVSEVSLNTKKQKVLLLKTAIPFAHVNCTLDEAAENIKATDKITIKGICSGIGQGDAELGIMADVYLARCIVSNKN